MVEEKNVEEKRDEEVLADILGELDKSGH